MPDAYINSIYITLFLFLVSSPNILFCFRKNRVKKSVWHTRSYIRDPHYPDTWNENQSMENLCEPTVLSKIKCYEWRCILYLYIRISIIYFLPKPANHFNKFLYIYAQYICYLDMHLRFCIYIPTFSLLLLFFCKTDTLNLVVLFVIFFFVQFFFLVNDFSVWKWCTYTRD